MHLQSIKAQYLFLFSQRSYSAALIELATQRMVKANIKTNSELDQFNRLKTRVDRILADKADFEEDLGDVPDEFMGQWALWLLSFCWMQMCSPCFTFRMNIIPCLRQLNEGGEYLIVPIKYPCLIQS